MLFSTVALWPVKAEVNLSRKHSSHTLVDSIISKAISMAPIYENIVQDYYANLYIKGHLDIKKRNFGLRSLPKMFR